MTNIFKILWFEDDTTWFTMESKIIKRELQNVYSFQTKIDKRNGAYYNLDSLKKDNNYDLILMDYKLAAGNTGEKIVNLIRENAILTDVILYSSQYDDMVSVLKAETPLIDGVFFADRKRELFNEKLMAVINKIVRRSEDIVNLRGFFLDNTSDFEVRIKELLKISWDKLPAQREQLQNCMTSVLEKIESMNKKTIEDIRNEDNIYNAANNSKYALNINGRLIVLETIIDILQSCGHITINDENSELSNFKNSYVENISIYRNALSHKKYSDTSLMIKGKNVSIDEEFYKMLRKTISRYNDLLLAIENIFVGL